MRQRSRFNGLRLTDKLEEFLRTRPETPFLAMDGDVAALEIPQHARVLSAPEAAATRAMLAVLPFENLSEDDRQEYFVDGLTEELTAQLGQLQPARLGVVARTSTVRYKRTTASAAQIGRELGVDYLLEGSVRRAGERVRVIAQLVDASKQTRFGPKPTNGPSSTSCISNGKSPTI